MDKRLKLLEEYRQANDLSQTDMASILKLGSPQAYHNWIKRGSVPKNYYDTADELVGEGRIDAEIIEKFSQLTEAQRKLAELYLDALLSQKQ